MSPQAHTRNLCTISDAIGFCDPTARNGERCIFLFVLLLGVLGLLGLGLAIHGGVKL